MSLWDTIFGKDLSKIGNVSGGGNVITNGSVSIGRVVDVELNESATVSINGKTFSGCKSFVIEGRGVNVSGVDVIIDGVVVDKLNTGMNLPPIDIEIFGNCGSVKTVSGDIHVDGVVGGDVKTTSGNITSTKLIQGNVNTVSGDVRSSEIKGSVRTVSGNIKSSK